MRTKRKFCERFVYLQGKPISFAGREYLTAIYASTARRLVIRASRQVEKSTFLVNTIVHAAIKKPGIHIVFVCPRKEQASVFSNSRLIRTIQTSPCIRRTLLGGKGAKLQVMNMHFANGSEVYVRAAYHSADSVRGIDADMLLIDEFQDISDGQLPVLEEALSHSKLRRVLLTGTPKTIDNHLEGVFRQSTACEYTVPCRGCGRRVLLDERCLGATGLACPDCHRPLDATQGAWISRNPGSSWGDGFWINHLMVPWVDYAELLERQRVYNPALFRNECLGLPTTLGDHIVTREELEACCRKDPMARGPAGVPVACRGQVVAGIDWGGGGTSRTVLVLGYMDSQYRFVVIYLQSFRAGEDPHAVLDGVVKTCKHFGVRMIGADGGGNGTVYNRLLVDRLKQQCLLHAILYSTSDHAPYPDGLLMRWTVNRSASIGVLFGRVKKQQLLLPRVDDCRAYLAEIAGEVAIYDEAQRSIKYTHPETQPDDALHATNYALLVAILAHGARTVYGG